MRKLFALILALIFAAPAAASASTFSLSGWTARAGQPETFTIRRVAGVGGQYVTFRTSDGSAKAPLDYGAVNLTVRFGPYQKSATVFVATVANQAQAGKTLSFTGTIYVSGVAVSSAGASIVEPVAPPLPVPPPPPSPPATQTCPDGTVILATSACPVLAPPAPPPPVVNTGYVPSPSLAGLADTPAADFVLNSAIRAAVGALPGSSAPDVVGAFRFICTAGQVLPDDPIVFPGQPGKSHLHQFYGNEAVDAFTDYTSLRAKGTSTCQRGVAVPGNRSGYWMPAMLDGAGKVVKPNFAIIYYKRRPATDPKCSLTSGDPKAEGNCLPIPNGLKFIFGYDMLTGKSPTGNLWFNCQGPSAVPGHYANLTLALANCPAVPGNQVGAIIEAPSCWDGKNLDSPNHRDHVGYPGYGSLGYLKCDAAHSYVIPSFTLGAWYPVASGMHLSSDAMVPGALPGTTFHADYFEGWEPTVKAMFHDFCINKMLNCSAGILGNGYELIGAAI